MPPKRKRSPSLCSSDEESGNESNSWEDWQNKQGSLGKCFEFLRRKEDLCDITFVVGEKEVKRFKAHKLVLAVCSPVFYPMFFGQLAEVKSEISLPDVHPEGFMYLLR